MNPILSRLEAAGWVASVWEVDPGRPGPRRRLVVLAALPLPRIRRLATARRIAGIGILGVAIVAGGSWVVGFGRGMGMADAFMTTGGDAAISGPILAVIGLVYLVAALLIGLLPSRIRSPRVENAGDLAPSP